MKPPAENPNLIGRVECPECGAWFISNKTRRCSKCAHETRCLPFSIPLWEEIDITEVWKLEAGFYPTIYILRDHIYRRAGYLDAV